VSLPFSTQQFEQKSNRALRRSRVRVDNIVSTQVYVDAAKVRHLASLDPSDIDSDPIVSRQNGHFILGDGHHRVGAAIKRGDRYINVKVSR